MLCGVDDFGHRVAAVDHRALLETMLSDLESAPELYRPTDFWQTGLRDVVRDLRRRGFDDFRRHPSAKRFYAPRYGPVARQARALSALIGLIGSGGRLARARLDQEPVARLDHAVVETLDPAAVPPYLAEASESTFGSPEEQFVFGGRRYSRSSLNYLRGLVMLKRAVPDLEIRTVLEIGGGFGTLGEILLPHSPEITYVDVDIPPVAAVATWYLCQVLGADGVLDYARTRDWEKIDLDEMTTRAAVLCSWQLPRVVGSVDLFVNFISFQEMEPHVVANYAELVAGLGARYLLLRNSPTGKPGVREPVVRDTYMKVFPDYELVAANASLYGQDREGTTSEVMVLVRR